jgi:hypothetical protein
VEISQESAPIVLKLTVTVEARTNTKVIESVPIPAAFEPYTAPDLSFALPGIPR